MVKQHKNQDTPVEVRAQTSGHDILRTRLNAEVRSSRWSLSRAKSRDSNNNDFVSKREMLPVEKIENIYFKCEYFNLSGSVKDRGISFQVEKVLQSDAKSAVISSSGNAAISAAYYCQMAGIDLQVFVSPKVNQAKLNILEKLGCKVTKTVKPISAAIKYAKENKSANLRQSTDPNAIFGYENIAYELNEQVPGIDAIFLPVSSGTTLAGIACGFRKIGYLPSFHLVQTEAVHPLASLFDHKFIPRKESLADAIVAKFTPRHDEILEIINKSKGFGWVISDKEMRNARHWLLLHDLNCSYEGAAALAAFWKAKKSGFKYHKPVCLLTGRFY
ncbi:PLP-dependent lyase/thiolase [Candidatus Gottesmanbacteria bacterium]|nr:PLP-dependent lyase/thiolase [Candidatus Gottesmanbacteria bacterium]